jgi:hypothetical protein
MKLHSKDRSKSTRFSLLLNFYLKKYRARWERKEKAL